MRFFTIIIVIISLFPLTVNKFFGQVKYKDRCVYFIQSRIHHEITQGFNMKLLMAPVGIIGKDVLYYLFLTIEDLEKVIGLEYPEGSSVEHLYSGGLWIGALVDTIVNGVIVTKKYVSTSDGAEGPALHPDYFSEMMPVDTANPWYYRSVTTGDSGAVSESDYVCEYTDTVLYKESPLHNPLGVKVIQRSYAWGNAVSEPVIPIHYTLINVGRKTLRKVYIGLYFDPDVGTTYYQGYFRDNFSGYFPELRTAYVHNTSDADATPLGVTILGTPEPLTDLNYRFSWFCCTPITSTYPYYEDGGRYDLMSGEAFPGQPMIKPNQSIDDQGDISLLFSFGPIEKWEIGETLRVVMALVCGFGLSYGNNNLYDNAKAALTLYARRYIPPVMLPSPKLRIETGFRKVELHWGYTGTGVNPLEVWDDASQLIQIYSPDHWRRINPPEGHTRGGRIFEGYRLYRSEDPAGTAKSFTMVRQWDLIDTVGPQYYYDTGVETTYVDDNLTTGKTYWYSITSFGIPDYTVIDYIDWEGKVKKESLSTSGKETSVLASRKRVKLPFSVSNELNQVAVVPNPYRINEDYTFESGGYEGRQRSWTEDKRMLKFIHLPPKCTIRIFTMTGEIVSTIYHEDPTQGEHNWDLKSDSNRSIASGVYVFTVESDYGKQIGKFVVIR